MDISWKKRAKVKKKWLDDIYREMDLVSNYANITTKYDNFRIATLQEDLTKAQASIPLPDHLNTVMEDNLDNLEAERVQELEVIFPIDEVHKITNEEKIWRITSEVDNRLPCQSVDLTRCMLPLDSVAHKKIASSLMDFQYGVREASTPTHGKLPTTPDEDTQEQPPPKRASKKSVYFAPSHTILGEAPTPSIPTTLTLQHDKLYDLDSTESVAQINKHITTMDTKFSTQFEALQYTTGRMESLLLNVLIKMDTQASLPIINKTQAPITPYQFPSPTYGLKEAQYSQI